MTLSCGRRRAAALLGIFALGACATAPPVERALPPTVEVSQDPEWKSIADIDDQQRIERLGEAWDNALGEARSRGFGRAVQSEGELLRPNAGLARPEPTPGSYHCRLVRLGGQGPTPPFSSYKPFYCYVQVEGELLTIVKQTGSQRPSGRLYPDDDQHHLIFLGTLSLGTEDPFGYGENPERDMAGIFERIGPFRFRLVVPWPRAESKLDVIELVPVPLEQQPG